MRRIAVVAAVVGVVAVGLWLSGGLRRLGIGRAPRSNLLLISIDTLRADHLGSYGYAAAETPALDALAARGLRFSQATTVTPLTLPAHTSLLTGTFPAFHGVRDNGGFYVGDDQLMLAEVLKQHGYRTGGFVGAFVLDGRWGINQGFDRYFDDFDLSKFDMAVGLDAAQRPGREVVDRTIEWLDQERDQPFFAWVHLYDPHTPYAAPDPFRARFPRTMIGSYDAEIASVDSQVSRLVQHLTDAGRLTDTIVVVVGDHGESLGEHREQAHGFFIYDATTHIPLIIAGPGVPERVVSSQVRIIDIMPTALHLLHVEVPKVVQGASLLPLASGAPGNLVALSETWYPRYHYGWSELMSIRDGRYKFIAAPRRELYDLQADPGETTDLSTSNPRLTDTLDQALRDLVTRTSSHLGDRGPQPVDPDVEERLRALGYVGSSVSRRNLEERPRGDPKDKIALYNLLKQAASDSINGQMDDAIAKVQMAIAADADIVEAYTMLGNMHVKAKRYEQGVAAYQKALALDSEHEGAAFSLALAFKQMGRLADAEAGFERVLTLNPRSTKSQWQLADIWMQRGEFDRAEGTLKDALNKKVERPSFLVKLGESYYEQNRYDEAERVLREAIELKSDQASAHYDLALILEARERPQDAVAEYQAELQLNPKMYRAHFNLAKLMANQGRTADAVVHFREAVSAQPDFAAGYLYLAKALLDAGDLPASEEAARKGLAAKPDDEQAPLGHYVLADVYSRMGRPRDAAREAAAGQRLERQARAPSDGSRK